MPLFDQIMKILGCYLPEESIPDCFAITYFIESSDTENPYRIIYNMVTAAAIKTSLMASKMSDDGVSFQSGTGLGSLEKLLPMFEKQAERWDADNGESFIKVLHPQDDFSERLDESL